MSNSKKVRPAWAVGANLQAIRELKTMHLRIMTEKEYEQLIKRLEAEYREALKVAESHYP